MALLGTKRVNIARISVTSLVFLIGVSAAVQRFSAEPLDLVARLGDTVSENMSAAAVLLILTLSLSCQLPLTFRCKTSPLLSVICGDTIRAQQDSATG